MKFFNRIAAPMAASAWATSIFYITVGAVKAEMRLEEQRKQQYIVHGEKPPTRFIGTVFEFTPPKEPSSERPTCKIGL